MRHSWGFLLLVCCSQALAVDGAGDQTLGMLVLLILLVAIAGIASLALIIVQYLRGSRDTTQVPIEVVPSDTDVIQFSDDESNLMQRWNIFSNGKMFRVGDRKFDTLSEALIAAKSLRNDGGGL